jgi:SAM-dependent methyltransferase
MRVVGVEPDAELISAASARVTALPNVETRAGSAEHLPFDDGTVDAVHARFAYFWGEGYEGAVTETLRVVRDGGSLVVVDNDHTRGEFADLLRACDAGFMQRRQPEIDQWWANRGAEKFTVLSSWEFPSRADLEVVLGNESRGGTADPWLAANVFLSADGSKRPIRPRATRRPRIARYLIDCVNRLPSQALSRLSGVRRRSPGG